MAADFAPVHPGEILLEEYMKPLGLTNAALARAISVSKPTIGQIVKGRRSITPDTAARLAKAFDTTERFWLILQLDYDLEVFDDSQHQGLDQIRPLVGAA
ncbi:HigA family addiction module antitoxin [Microbacterium sp. NPDC019599]|uniref:HigA family addiction module antitoxin n=1 Tax=Microbacterium sp. NPDC019599 TaxID=3154690 RepID=UPI0033EF72AC